MSDGLYMGNINSKNNELILKRANKKFIENIQNYKKISLKKRVKSEIPFKMD